MDQDRLVLRPAHQQAHFTLKQNRLSRTDLDEFVECYSPEDRSQRKNTWTAKRSPDGRFRSYSYAEITSRGEANFGGDEGGE